MSFVSNTSVCDHEFKKGQSSDGKISNEHPNSEQWVYVVSGSGKVSNGKTTINLKKGDLVLIEKKGMSSNY